MQPARHFFPGGNTSQGFHSFFDHLLPMKEARRIFILKGGPGVGKSTFMRRMGRALEEGELAVEYVHCASDSESLDAVICPSIGLMLLDGTAPHMVDPRLPGAVDGIINLGELLDEEGLALSREEIAAVSADVSSWFARAFHYLNAAQALRQDTTEALHAHTDAYKLAQLLRPWLETITAHREPDTKGHERKLFASAISPQGRVQFLNTLALPRLWRVTGPWGSDTHEVMARLRDAAVSVGLMVEGFYCPIAPTQLEHLCIPTLNLFITTENDYHQFSAVAERTIDLRATQPAELPTPLYKALAYNRGMFDQLLAQAIAAIGQAKALHDDLEKYYVRRMDFAAIDPIYERTWKKIQALI